MGTERSETSTPVRVRKIGHIVFRVSDIERSTRFWTDVMGFQVCDGNEMGMVFLRYGADHHNIGLASVKEGESFSEGKSMGFMHCAMEVGSVTELFKIRDFLRLKGVPIVFEGRRGAGCNVGIEFLDPDGNMIELYASMDQIGREEHSRPHEQWRRAKSLEEAVANPVLGAEYD